MLAKPLVIHANANKKAFKNKVLEERKTDLKSIFKTFDDISKKELERSKKLYEEHVSFFKESSVPAPEVVVVNDDHFFEK